MKKIGYFEKVIIGGSKSKVYREWRGDCWEYDRFNTRLFGKLTSTESPVDGVCPEGQLYTVLLETGGETYSRNFGRYSEARAFLDRARFAESIYDALKKDIG